MGGGETLFIYLGGKGRLVFDYLRLSHMIGDGSLLPIQAEEGESERYLLTRERESNGKQN
jgi:hypothetical protein